MAVNKSLVNGFIEKAEAVEIRIHEAKDVKAAVSYVIDVLEKKKPCELLDEEEGTVKGPMSENNLPTRTDRIIAVPEVDDATFKLVSDECAKRGYICIKDNLRKYLAGIDMGLVNAKLGISETGSSLIVSNGEDLRLATMISEIVVLILKKSDIKPDLLSVAEDLRKLQKEGQASYTAFMTGASRTSDIERVLTIGVHGPLEQHIVLLEG